MRIAAHNVTHGPDIVMAVASLEDEDGAATPDWPNFLVPPIQTSKIRIFLFSQKLKMWFAPFWKLFVDMHGHSTKLKCYF